MSNRDRVQALYGVGVADVLASEGLIRPDTATDNPTPTHWKVYVTVTQAARDHGWVHNLPSEFKYALHHIGITVFKMWDNEKNAKRIANMARKAGYDVRLVPCALVELLEEVP